MRIALLSVLVVCDAVLAGNVNAQQTFCAVNSQGATNCAFASIDACRDEVRGDGGFCIPQAPIGHRQPRASDVVGSRNDTENPNHDQKNRKPNRSRQLCRGC